LKLPFLLLLLPFGKVIRATSIGGFLIKLKLFILAYDIDMFFKLSTDNQSLAFN